jgi:hypothetical protein
MVRFGLRLLAALSACLCLVGSLSAETLRSEQGQFVVDFPLHPTLEKMDGRTADGSASFTRLTWCVASGKQGWCVFLTTYDKPITNNPEYMMHGGLKAANMTLRSANPVVVDRLQGIEYYGDRAADGIAGRVRVFIASTRLYQVIYSGPKGTETSPPVEAYMKSFHVW